MTACAVSGVAGGDGGHNGVKLETGFSQSQGLCQGQGGQGGQGVEHNVEGNGLDGQGIKVNSTVTSSSIAEGTAAADAETVHGSTDNANHQHAKTETLTNLDSNTKSTASGAGAPSICIPLTALSSMTNHNNTFSLDSLQALGVPAMERAESLPEPRVSATVFEALASLPDDNISSLLRSLATQSCMRSVKRAFHDEEEGPTSPVHHATARTETERQNPNKKRREFYDLASLTIHC